MRTRRLQAVCAGSSIACIAAAGLCTPARAERPVLTGEAAFGEPGGEILVHYATSGPDATPTLDADQDGVPDFVAEVADTAESALEHFIALGFVRPLDDGARGGDGRIDIYLRNLNNADGNASTDSCEGGRCVGYTVAENDYKDFGYSSVTEGIRSVVPHELFHLVQSAYSTTQVSTWTEGSAVWSVENLYGVDNSDFERFLPSFLTKSFRPFERPVGSFGDNYPYGAALWPYFLEQRFGAAAIVDAWAASAAAPFLDAVDHALQPLGSTTDDAWVEMTRWNVLTGARAAGGPYPDASAWPEVPREEAIAAAGKVYVEGLSARYVPINVASRSQLELTPTSGIRIAGWVVRDGDRLADGIELVGDPVLSATLDPGSYTLVVTGLSRGTITTEVDVSLDQPRDDAGGCASSRGAHPAVVMAAAMLWRRRRRSALRA